jgi:hypothetical protein
MAKRSPPIPDPIRARWRAQALPDAIRFTRFRSQLEIRFATELEARRIRWFYEPERLGEGKYLVDFYLPDLRTWVEVKGRVSSRDHLVLREVAALVARERHQRLYMWTDSYAYRVTPLDFERMTHDAFWSMLVPPVSDPGSPGAG